MDDRAAQIIGVVLLRNFIGEKQNKQYFRSVLWVSIQDFKGESDLVGDAVYSKIENDLAVEDIRFVTLKSQVRCSRLLLEILELYIHSRTVYSWSQSYLNLK